MPYSSKKAKSPRAKKADAVYKKTAKISKPGEGRRFKTGAKALQAKGYSKKSADAIMASAGRKKYGDKKMANWSSKGREK